MELNEYQKEVESAVAPRREQRIVRSSLALMGAAEGLASLVMQSIRDKEGNFASEETKLQAVIGLGDVLYRTAQVARDLGVSLEHAAYFSLAKLRSQQEKDTTNGEQDNR